MTDKMCTFKALNYIYLKTPKEEYKEGDDTKKNWATMSG